MFMKISMLIENKQLKLYSVGSCLFSFSKFTFGFHSFHLTQVKIIQNDFELGKEEYLVLNS